MSPGSLVKLRPCVWCGRSGHHATVFSVRGRPVPTSLCEICSALYGRGSEYLRRRYEQDKGLDRGEERARCRASRAVHAELLCRPLRAALFSVVTTADGRLDRFYGRCQWCGVADLVSAARQLYTEEHLDREEMDRRLPRCSDSLKLYWAEGSGVVEAQGHSGPRLLDPAALGMVLLRVVAHPDPNADAGPHAVVAAPHPLRVLCSTCTALLEEQPDRPGDGPFGVAMRASSLMTIENRLITRALEAN